jgi:hypothetical protein
MQRGLGEIEPGDAGQVLGTRRSTTTDLCPPASSSKAAQAGIDRVRVLEGDLTLRSDPFGRSRQRNDGSL